jgi:hypothetical protein
MFFVIPDKRSEASAGMTIRNEQPCLNDDTPLTNLPKYSNL